MRTIVMTTGRFIAVVTATPICKPGTPANVGFAFRVQRPCVRGQPVTHLQADRTHYGRFLAGWKQSLKSTNSRDTPSQLAYRRELGA